MYKNVLLCKNACRLYRRSLYSMQASHASQNLAPQTISACFFTPQQKQKKKEKLHTLGFWYWVVDWLCCKP